jgi:hypothetical protein
MTNHTASSIVQLTGSLRDIKPVKISAAESVAAPSSITARSERRSSAGGSASAIVINPNPNAASARATSRSADDP